MNEADKIRMKNYEQQINMLEKENKALRKEIFKYKLKDGEMTDTESIDTAQDILAQIRAKKAKASAANKIFEQFYSNFGALDD